MRWTLSKVFQVGKRLSPLKPLPIAAPCVSAVEWGSGCLQNCWSFLLTLSMTSALCSFPHMSLNHQPTRLRSKCGFAWVTFQSLLASDALLGRGLLPALPESILLFRASGWRPTGTVVLVTISQVRKWRYRKTDKLLRSCSGLG